MMTLDPVSTGDAGWEAFLDAYNEFSIQSKGVPLFNQSPQLTPAQAKRALGPEMKAFQEIRRTYDPTNRMYTDFFRELFE
jgi:FAD/FMN-containing dehydrogenase